MNRRRSTASGKRTAKSPWYPAKKRVQASCELRQKLAGSSTIEKSGIWQPIRPGMRRMPSCILGIVFALEMATRNRHHLGILELEIRLCAGPEAGTAYCEHRLHSSTGKWKGIPTKFLHHETNKFPQCDATRFPNHTHQIFTPPRGSTRAPASALLPDRPPAPIPARFSLA